jgi:nucleoside-triphosphatase THEP1
MKNMARRSLYLITGVQGSGKTTFCQALVDSAVSDGRSIAGVISPPVMVEGRKVGIDIVDLCTKQRRRLANTIDRGGNGPKTIRWAFNGKALAWGNQVLGNIPACDLLVIDELGPLEFERGEGWMHGFTAVDDGDFTLAVVVIRPDLVDKALEKWPYANILEIDKPENVDALAEEFFTNSLT